LRESRLVECSKCARKERTRCGSDGRYGDVAKDIWRIADVCFTTTNVSTKKRRSVVFDIDNPKAGHQRT